MGMIFLSDEDVDSKAIISSWLSKNNADENLTRLMDEMFIRGKIRYLFIHISLINPYFTTIINTIVVQNFDQDEHYPCPF